MAEPTSILARLCDLQATNFEVIDCQVKEEEIVWQVQHKSAGVYICSRCGAEHATYHDRRWITLYDVPFGKKRCKWLVNRVRPLCTCTLFVRVEKLPFRSNFVFLRLSISNIGTIFKFKLKRTIQQRSGTQSASPKDASLNFYTQTATDSKEKNCAKMF
jgi:hypothetical protein